MSIESREAQAPTSTFDVAGFTGEVNDELRPVEMEAALELVADPGRALETLHWGRNYLYTVELETMAGPRVVVVKQFRNQGLAARLKRRWTGSKATKSWRAAWAVHAAGIRTPVPVLLAESVEPEGPSFYVCERLDDFFESRYFFRALIAGNEAEAFPAIDSDELIAALGDACGRMHNAGIWHRDVSIGNLLVQTEESGELSVTLIDLNRARQKARLGLWTRTRDVCRLPFPGRNHRALFLSSYWGEPLSSKSFKYRLFWVMQQSFLLRNRGKATLRRPLHALRDLFQERKAHAHIPAAPEDASSRDKIVWDHLSDQPHQHATRAERARVRMSDATAHGAALTALLSAAPRIWLRYRRLQKTLFETPVAWQGVGVALRPRPEDPEGLLAALEATGVRRVLMRLHPWEADRTADRELAAELHRRGYDLSFAVPQVRELVRDLDFWSAAVEEIAETFTPFGRQFQIGQAINRSKWGVWTYREYLALAARACDILRRYDGVEIMGPAVIDFEFQATAAVLNMKAEGVHFDIVSSLLYVDRRGQPENEQVGFDSPNKAALLKAIAEASRLSGDRCWVTEVNWPLWEGPHSPAGRTVSVDEETQANYLTRYYLLMLASGMIERVYWWRLIARGYGLVEPSPSGELRLRASHRALKALESQLGAGTFTRLLVASEEARLMLFEDPHGHEIAVGWSLDEPVKIELPRPAGKAYDRDGDEILLEKGREKVEVSASPTYFHLDS